MAEQKDSRIEMIRGLCILAVVFIHCPSGLAYQQIPGEEWKFWEWVTIRQLSNFAVGTFFFLSGYLTTSNAVKSAKQYIIKRCKRLLIPMYCWSLLYMGIQIIKDYPGVDSFALYGLKYLFGMSAGPFYFIIVMTQLVFLAPLIFRMAGSYLGQGILWLITPVWLGLQYIITLTSGSQIPHCEYFFMSWLIYYWAGIFLRRQAVVKLNSVNLSGIGVLCCTSLNLIEGYVLYALTGTGTFGTSQIRGGVVLYALSVSVFLMANGSKIASQILVKLGNLSYGVYYVHLLWLSVITHLLPSEIPFPVIQIVCWSTAVVGSYLTCRIIQRLVGKQRAHNILGI